VRHVQDAIDVPGVLGLRELGTHILDAIVLDVREEETIAYEDAIHI
jgi:hypothetical protein